MGELTALWQEAEQCLRTFEQLPHGAWTPALKERGIPGHVAKRMMRLRRKYPEIVQIARFESMQAALTDSKKDCEDVECLASTKRRPASTYLVLVDDLWDWKRGEPTPLAHRLLDADQIEQFTTNLVRELQMLVENIKGDAVLSAAVDMLRRRLTCHVNVGPLQDDPVAKAETEQRLLVFAESVVQIIQDAKSSHHHGTIDHVAKD